MWAFKLHPILLFPNLVNFQSSVAPKPMGVSPHHWNQLSFYFHLMQVRASQPVMFWSYNWSKYLPPGHVYHAPCLARSCCKVMTSQCYRDTGGVEFHVNYLEPSIVFLQVLVPAAGQVQKRTSRAWTCAYKY